MKERKRILVLGASGFVGRHVLAALQAGDWAQPTAATRSARLPAGATGQVVALDSTDTVALRAALQGMDGVVDCTAGSPAAMHAHALALHKARAAMPVPPRLVFLSSMAVYGAAEGLVAEDAPLDTAAGLHSYGGAKVAAELLLRGDTGVVVLRPGCIYGGGSPQWSERIARLLQARRIGDMGAGGDGICNAVHVADVAQAVVAALRLPGAEGRAFNLSAAEAPTWNGYFLAFARALGAVPVRRIGGTRMKIETKLLAPFLKVAEIVAGRAGLHGSGLPPPIPPSLARLWRQEIRLDVRAAEEVLGLAWTSLQQGLQEAARSSPGR